MKPLLLIQFGEEARSTQHDEQQCRVAAECRRHFAVVTLLHNIIILGSFVQHGHAALGGTVETLSFYGGFERGGGHASVQGGMQCTLALGDSSGGGAGSKMC